MTTKLSQDGNPLTNLIRFLLGLGSSVGPVQGVQAGGNRVVVADPILNTILTQLAGNKRALRNIPIVVGIKSITPNFSNLFNSSKGARGSSMYTSIGSRNITIQTANYSKVKSLVDLGAAVRTANTDDNFMKVTKINNRVTQMSSSLPFICIPFVALLKHDEVITETNSTSMYPDTVIGSAVGTAIQSVVFGPTVASKADFSGGATSFVATYGIDLTDLWNAYASHYWQKSFASEDPMELIVGEFFNGVGDQVIGCHDEVGIMLEDKLPDMASLMRQGV